MSSGDKGAHTPATLSVIHQFCKKMTKKQLTSGIIAILMLGCSSVPQQMPDPANTPMHKWSREQLDEYMFFARVATHEVYKQKIKLPLGRHDWSNQKLRSILKRDYGIEAINAEDWSVPRYAGYSHIMKAAAEKKNGEGWWFDALKKSGIFIPIPD